MDPQAQPIESTTPVHDGKPYFMGDHALIKFSNGASGNGPEVYWLVDKDSQTLRPFESSMAMDAAFGKDLEEALKHVVVVAHPTIDSNGDIKTGVLKGFSVLDPEYSIKEDGSSKYLHFSPHHLRQRYGKPIHQENEDKATRALDHLLKTMKDSEHKSHIPPSYIEKIKRDHRLMAFYVSALAYGEYTLGDIYSDISHKYHHS